MKREDELSNTIIGLQLKYIVIWGRVCSNLLMKNVFAGNYQFIKWPLKDKNLYL